MILDVPRVFSLVLSCQANEQYQALSALPPKLCLCHIEEDQHFRLLFLLRVQAYNTIMNDMHQYQIGT